MDVIDLELYNVGPNLRPDLSILGACIGLFGIIGNVTAFRGFVKQKQKTSTSFLFQALAIADTLVIFTIYLDQSRFYLNLNRVHFVLNAVLSSFRYVAILSSNGITVLLTITRLIAVCFPLHTSRLCSITRVRYYLAATIIFSILCYIPNMVGQILMNLLDFG